MKKQNIKLVSDIKNFNVKSNFIFSAFNLAFIAYFFLGLIKPNIHFYLWCDGIIGKIYSKTKKIPGNKFITFFFKYKFSEIIVMGNYSKIQYTYLKKKFKAKINFIKLPLINDSNFKKFIPKVSKNSLVIITLPTPKQEILANEIRKYNKNFKIICIGGGLSIASGEIRQCPKILQNLGLEFIWRFNSDPWRRAKRLTLTFLIYIINLYRINKKLRINNI